jgi:hypothetical protein
MLRDMRKKMLKRKVKKYSSEVKRYQSLSKEYRTMGDNSTALYCDYKAAQFMYKESVTINKLVRA